jgi:hypothetical protein
VRMGGVGLEMQAGSPAGADDGGFEIGHGDRVQGW